jgi:hypothetical protein
VKPGVHSPSISARAPFRRTTPHQPTKGPVWSGISGRAVARNPRPKPATSSYPEATHNPARRLWTAAIDPEAKSVQTTGVHALAQPWPMSAEPPCRKAPTCRSRCGPFKNWFWRPFLPRRCLRPLSAAFVYARAAIIVRDCPGRQLRLPPFAFGSSVRAPVLSFLLLLRRRLP